ncbi:MAG TPA: hypothetical protein VHI52_15430, partial [Verrucomicrobiae bacterium]|nr:hypothetical protein [Verrucomicrobiae bacterium]
MSRNLKSNTDEPGLKRGEAADSDLDLALRGFQGTPEEIERQWFDRIYTGRGDSQPQLTLRAVLMGGILGMLMSMSNLYT